MQREQTVRAPSLWSPWPDRRVIGAAALILSVGLPALVLAYQVRAGVLGASGRGVVAVAGLVSLLAIPLHFLTLRWHLSPLTDRLLTDRKRLRETAARGARAQEMERIRIARDLRDDLAQRLTSILLRLPVLQSLPDAAERQRLLEEVCEDVRSSIERMRGFAQAVHPPALAELGVVAALRSYARTLATGSSLHVEVVESGVAVALPPETALALYRIAQESLANVVRHANADHARVLIDWDRDGEMFTVITDDGIGFDIDRTEARHPCLGLFSIQERALAVGGSVRVESSPGHGTSVTVRMPVGAGMHTTAAPWPTILPTGV